MINAKLTQELEQNTELKTYLIVFREQKSVQYDWNVVYVDKYKRSQVRPGTLLIYNFGGLAKEFSLYR